MSPTLWLGELSVRTTRGFPGTQRQRGTCSGKSNHFITCPSTTLVAAAVSTAAATYMGAAPSILQSPLPEVSPSPSEAVLPITDAETSAERGQMDAL